MSFGNNGGPRDTAVPGERPPHDRPFGSSPGRRHPSRRQSSVIRSGMTGHSRTEITLER